MALTEEDLRAAMPDRPVRAFPALLSTEAEALARARAGDPSGTLITADYQVAPRGRGGTPWDLDHDGEVALSLVLRPTLPPTHAGWLYLVAGCALADVAGDDAATAWPDQVLDDGHPWGAVGVQTEPGPDDIRWAVMTLRVPRGADVTARVCDVVAAVEQRVQLALVDVVERYRARCQTLGRQVTARLVPLGPGGMTLTGLARDVRDDGALILETRNGQRFAIPPDNLGRLDEAL